MQNLKQTPESGLHKAGEIRRSSPDNFESRLPMRKPIISLLVLGCFLSWQAFAQEAPMQDAQIKEDAPDRHVVEKGDTLWGIAGKFLSEPWRWPEIWQLNKDEIKNPHRIYPGDVVVLDLSSGSPRLKLVKNQKYLGRDVVVMSPTSRVEARAATPAIPLISPADIGPFLSQPLVVEKGSLETAPEIVASEENRVIIGAGNRAYVAGLRQGDPLQWQVFRAGNPFTDPDTGETLGYEAVYLGEAKVKAFGESSTIEVGRAVQEINRGDRLVKLSESELANFIPHAPQKKFRGRILTMYSGVAEAGPKSIVTINRGARDGIEQGHVLAILRHGREALVTKSSVEEDKPLRSWHQDECMKKDAKVSFNEPYDRAKVWERCPGKNPIKDRETVTLPDERYGLLLVFRTFDRVSYGLVMQSTLAVQQGDVVTTP